jgi:hypothetical protein
MKMPAHQLARVWEGDFTGTFIHVLPAFFIERFLLLMLGGKSLHWLNRSVTLKVASACEFSVSFFSSFCDCCAFFDVSHASFTLRQKATTVY